MPIHKDVDVLHCTKYKVFFTHSQPQVFIYLKLLLVKISVLSAVCGSVCVSLYHMLSDHVRNLAFEKCCTCLL